MGIRLSGKYCMNEEKQGTMIDWFSLRTKASTYL